MISYSLVVMRVVSNWTRKHPTRRLQAHYLICTQYRRRAQRSRCRRWTRRMFSRSCRSRTVIRSASGYRDLNVNIRVQKHVCEEIIHPRSLNEIYQSP